MKIPARALAPVVFLFAVAAGALAGEPQLRPWSANPYYWQYEGKPVRLVGGSDDDNLFQTPHVEKQLDKIAAAGGNYIRNTMSDRQSKGFEVYPFQQLDSGKYDLTKWNPEYWRRFENLLAECDKRDIIVQIEIWDRFDYSRKNWESHPYNPKNNVNYSYEKSGFAKHYPQHPGRNKQPFFFTVPELENNKVVLRFQKAFVAKMLSISLQYPNVLYCIDNETSADPAWPIYWTKFIRRRAEKADHPVNITEMWDDWNVRGKQHRYTLDHPERYNFIDMSQNTHNSGQTQWDNLMWVRRYIAKRPRPINHVKIYGADTGRFGNSRDAIERFWRLAIGGAASFRFHRPDSGLGMSELSARQIRASRKLEQAVNLFACQPDADSELLQGRRKDEAYLTDNPRKVYVVYFPRGGQVALDLSQAKGPFRLRWLIVKTNSWSQAKTVKGGREVPLKSPAKSHAIAVLIAKP